MSDALKASMHCIIDIQVFWLVITVRASEQGNVIGSVRILYVQ